MDDLRERLGRLAARVDERTDPFRRLERRRAGRARVRKAGTAVLALAVGAAATFGVVRAFEGEARPQAAWAPPALLTVWPEGVSRHVTVDPAVVQAGVDEGDPSLQWRTDPRKVALRFGESTLSWDVRHVVDMGAERHPVHGSIGSVALLSSCPKGAACYVTHLEEVHLVQPARQGDGGIWSVGWVVGDISSPEIDPGSHLGRDGLIRFSDYEYRSAERPIVGLTWFDGCVAGSTAQRVAEGQQPTISLSTLSLPPPTEGCSAVAAGMAYAVRSEDGFGDPIDEVDSMATVGMDGSSVPFGGRATDLSLVPFTFDLPAASAEGSLTTYTDPLGWSIDVPADWTVLPIDASNGETNLVGAAFSDGPLVAAEVERRVSPWSVVDRSRLEPEQGVLVVLHTDPGSPPRVADDSSFPLTPSEASILNANPPYDRALPFRGDGLAFGAWYGPTTNDSQRHVMEDMVRSIRFEPWSAGEQRNSWRAFGLASDVPADEFVWHDDGSGDWIVFSPEPGREQFGYVNAPCEEPEFTGTADAAVMTCPGGSINAWDRRAEPLPRNDPEYAVPLERFPVIRSWDGYLLVGPPGCQGVCH